MLEDQSETEKKELMEIMIANYYNLSPDAQTQKYKFCIQIFKMLIQYYA